MKRETIVTDGGPADQQMIARASVSLGRDDVIEYRLSDGQRSKLIRSVGGSFLPHRWRRCSDGAALRVVDEYHGAVLVRVRE